MRTARGAPPSPRRIDEQRRPLPKILKLGSLSQICAELDMPASGKNTNNVKRAILQNAGSLITAKLTYNSVDGLQRRLEAVFTRYSVAFTGERLPNGKEADGVSVCIGGDLWFQSSLISEMPRHCPEIGNYVACP